METNPDRDFYSCPGISASPKQQHGCNNPAKPDHQHGADESSYPICPCGAGRCRVFTMMDGDNAGCKYFACRIKKDQGASNHFQWVDSPAKLSGKTGILSR
ncbi:uncharacterized protein LOC103712377 isoform X2 [Phoenix dactylifera]|uniref:Uncharacterized protein LOC103712377 isoform X2 n=1 Tax=Phoenix dactylifera TaxID=42345 RepID=A0A8B7CDX3_PHODC|nr:uncharacterized protein LOC103712377 isoform X2 [Phoenix dactylifera]